MWRTLLFSVPNLILYRCTILLDNLSVSMYEYNIIHPKETSGGTKSCRRRTTRETRMRAQKSYGSCVIFMLCYIIPIQIFLIF